MTTPTTPARLPGLLAAGLIAALIAAPARAETKLLWKFAKGQKFSWTLSTRTRSKMDVGGQKVETAQSQEMDMTWEVKEVDADGRASMSQTIDRVRVSMEGGPVGKAEFDSDDPKEPEGPLAGAAPLFRSMVGAPCELKMSARGEIGDVKLSPKMLDGIKNAGAMAQAAGPMFTEEGVKKMTSQGSLILPEGAIAVGKSWPDVKTLELPFGELVTNNTYTYQGNAGDAEKVGVALRLSLRPKAGSPVEVTLTSGDGKGSFTFDSGAGALRSSEVVTTMKMDVVAAGQTIKVETESTTSMSPAKRGASK